MAVATRPSAPPAPPSSATPPPALLHTLVLRALGPLGPLAGARLCAAPLAGDERCGATGPDGRAALTLLAGTYLVRGEPPAGARLDVARQAVTLDADRTLELALPQRALIAGAVRDDAGVAVPGASICAHRAGEETACARSGSDGGYALRVAPGVYRLKAEGPPGARLLGQWAFDRVDSGHADPLDLRDADIGDADIVLERGVALEGTIRAARDAHPIERAQVCTKTLAAPLPFACERTVGGGTYRALRAPGRYWIWVVPPDHEPLLAQWYDRAGEGVRAKAFDLQTDSTLDVALEPGPRITGHLRTATGAPVAGAKVCADTPFATGRICRETDAAGAYSITTRPETYVLNVQPPEGSDLVAAYHAGKRTWAEADAVTVGRADVTVELVIAAGARVSGTVRDTTGVPVEDADVSLSDGDGWLAGASTDAAGGYVLAVPPGRYVLDVFAPRFGAFVSVAGLPLVVDGPTTADATLPLGPP